MLKRELYNISSIVWEWPNPDSKPKQVFFSGPSLLMFRFLFALCVWIFCRLFQFCFPLFSSFALQQFRISGSIKIKLIPKKHTQKRRAINKSRQEMRAGSSCLRCALLWFPFRGLRRVEPNWNGPKSACARVSRPKSPLLLPTYLPKTEVHYQL